jgi:hypothetical protein
MRVYDIQFVKNLYNWQLIKIKNIFLENKLKKHVKKIKKL